MDLTLTVSLTDAQIAGLKHEAGEQSIDAYLVTDIQVKADNAVQRLKVSELQARQAAFDSLPDEQQALVGAIVLKMPTAAPEVQAEVIEGAAKIAAALGIDPSALVNVKAAKIQSK